MKQVITRKIVRRKRKTASRDFELCSRFQAGDLSVFPELSKNYSGLIKTVALKYEKQGLPKDELILHAKIGLIKAAHRFDESKMVSFRLYAIWWMRQAVLKALHEHARIEQVPEMLITNLHELMHSFTRRDQVLLEGHEEVQQTVGYKIHDVLRLRDSGKQNQR